MHTLRSELAATIRLAGPVAGAQLAQVSLGFIDTVMVGRLGETALASVALGSTLYFFLFIMCIGVMQAVGPLVAQAFGREEPDAIGRVVRQGLWLGLLLAIPAFFVLRNLEPLLVAAGQDPVVAAQAQAYLKALSWGFLPALWFIGLRGFVEGVGQPWPVPVIAFTGAGVNIAANWVLMFGKLGFPALGVVGTGWASCIVYVSMCVALALIAGFGRPYRPYRVFASLRRPDVEVFRELFRVGWPIGVTFGMESGLFSMTAFLMGLLGPTVLAAHQVALQSAAFTFMLPLGIGIATAVRVGQAVGRADAAGVRWAGYVGMGLALAIMCATALLFWSAPRAVVSLYLDLDAPANAEVVTLAVALLGYAAAFQLFDGLQVSAAGALRGLKDTRVPMLIGFVAYWLIGLGTGASLCFGLGWGARGLWTGLLVGLAVAGVLNLLRFRHIHRRALLPAPDAVAESIPIP